MVTPVIEAGDITSSSNNSVDTTPDVSFPAYESGDLLVQWISVDNNPDPFIISTPANGPNGETLILDTTGDNGNSNNGPHTGTIAWIGDATIGASTLAWGIASSGEQWGGRCIKVPAGEFDSVTPIGEVSGYTTGGASDSATTIPTPVWTAGASDGGGRILVEVSTDADAIGGSPSGWTLLASADHGAVACAVAIRDAAAVNSTEITSVDYTLASDSNMCFGMIIREPAAASDWPRNPFGHALNGPLGGPM